MEHPLAAWLKREGKTQQDFARLIGRTPSYVSMLCSAQIWPSLETAKLIAEATGNEVTPDTLMRAA